MNKLLPLKQVMQKISVVNITLENIEPFIEGNCLDLSQDVYIERLEPDSAQVCKVEWEGPGFARVTDDRMVIKG